jgi:sec-independent protein translocase protein TatA
MGDLSPWHLLILAGVFVLLFGAKKLPDAARSLGRSARILKTELKDLHDEDGAAKDQHVQQTALPPAVSPAPVSPPAPPSPPASVVPDAPGQPVGTGDQTPAP